ncbi:ABC transporter ATP-binding protein [Vallitalea sediminicola]
MSIIELNNISKVYKGKGYEVHALKSINLKVNQGEILGIMGTSGCGKTTLLNILGCLDTSSAGTYLLKNRDITSYSSKEKANLRNKCFGFVLQDFALLNYYTVESNIELPMIYGKVKKTVRRQRIRELLEVLDISEKAKHYPDMLSGGQKQRVAIARALSLDADIILMDEPTGSLDAENTESLMSMISEIQCMNKTIIIVTHDNEVAKHCDRILHIHDGIIKI